MIIQAMPSGIVGGISFMLYGMIAAIGVRNVVEAQVDFKKSRNVIVAAIIVVCALGIKFSSGMGADVLSGVDGAVSFSIGGVVISLSGLAVASIAGIILNAVFPDKDESERRNRIQIINNVITVSKGPIPIIPVQKGKR